MNLSKLVEQGGCSLPWLHTEINLQSNQVTPCCKYKEHAGPANEFKSSWYGNRFSKLRSDIVNDVKHHECHACDVSKDSFSYKKWKNDVYSKRGLLESVNTDNVPLPKIFHFTLSNTCNLACRMCHPASSSKLFELSKKSVYLTNFYQYTPQKKINIESFAGNFSNAVHLTISGGEPLVDEDCYKLIEMVKAESSNLKGIAFSTNMTKLNLKLIDLLVSLNVKIHFNTSVDGPPHIQEYVRVNSNWNEILKNISYLKSLSDNFIFGINSTISALNVGYIPELLETLDQAEKELGIKFTHIMSTPVLESHLHPGSLPEQVKNFYKDKLIKSTITSNIMDSHLLVPTGLELLDKQQPEVELFQTFVTEFDRVVGTDYRKVYPEFGSAGEI